MISDFIAIPCTIRRSFDGLGDAPVVTVLLSASFIKRNEKSWTGNRRELYTRGSVFDFVWFRFIISTAAAAAALDSLPARAHRNQMLREIPLATWSLSSSAHDPPPTSFLYFSRFLIFLPAPPREKKKFVRKPDQLIKKKMMMKRLNCLVAKTKDRKKEKKRLTFFLLALRRLEEWPWIPVDCQLLERNKTPA